ncbi:MAG: hypothetical protein FWE17_00890 [Alphaproteobacteria bacterium]|nr:hypothetical protein [Alphaproteobacteria bacterium]MCL2757936.1 hypothetical protein [Alphaproteobacteria bacterium]
MTTDITKMRKSLNDSHIKIGQMTLSLSQIDVEIEVLESILSKTTRRDVITDIPDRLNTLHAEASAIRIERATLTKRANALSVLIADVVKARPGR